MLIYFVLIFCVVCSCCLYQKNSILLRTFRLLNTCAYTGGFSSFILSRHGVKMNVFAKQRIFV